MKKKIISVTIAVFLGTPSLSMAFNWGAGVADLGRTTPSSNWLFWKQPQNKQSKPKAAKPSLSQDYAQILELMRKQLEMSEKQLKETEKTHQSITKNKAVSTARTDHTSFFLKNPQAIYNKDRNSDASKLFEKILQEEEISASTNDVREHIDRRSRHAAIIDKAVSMQAFQDTENRFDQISKLLSQVDQTQDLKSIAELQARIKATLAMIQNETAKLQMVTHLRSAEQELISQQKQRRNMRILNHKNKEMPAIRSIR
ncbi:type IV secretion system protein [Bartonella sp. B41]